MKFNAVQIKHVMDKTGAAEWDCQRALSEQEGDVDAAIRFLFESSKVVLHGVQIYDWWRAMDEPLFTPEQYEQVKAETGADKFTCERALAETRGSLPEALELARRYMKEQQS